MTYWIEATGYAACALVFLTFCMKTLLPLRLVAILSNIAFIIYGFGAEVVPVLVLHTVLLPLNLLRTYQQFRLQLRVQRAARGDLSVDQLLPLMERRRVRAGRVIVRQGDHADFMFFISRGRVRLEQADIELGPGNLLGEIGLFADDRLRTDTIVATEDSEICVLELSRVESLLHSNPEFAFYLLRLITRRLQQNLQKSGGRRVLEPVPGLAAVKAN